MKKLSLITSVVVLFGSHSFAAQSGYYDSALKIQTALASPDLANLMHQLPIDSVSVQDTYGTVDVVSGLCTYLVALEADAPAGPGETTYLVKSIRGPFCTGLKK